MQYPEKNLLEMTRQSPRSGVKLEDFPPATASSQYGSDLKRAGFRSRCRRWTIERCSACGGENRSGTRVGVGANKRQFEQGGGRHSIITPSTSPSESTSIETTGSGDKLLISKRKDRISTLQYLQVGVSAVSVTTRETPSAPAYRLRTWSITTRRRNI